MNDELPKLHCHHDRMEYITSVMRRSNSGLEVKDRMWLKIPIPNAFIGSELVDWLHTHVEGFEDRRDARRYATQLLKQGLIKHTVNKITFSEQCYYVFGDSLVDEFGAQLRFEGSDADTINPPPLPAPWAMHPPRPPISATGGMVPIPAPPSSLQYASYGMPPSSYAAPMGSVNSLVSGGGMHVPPPSTLRSELQSNVSGGSGSSGSAAERRKANAAILAKGPPPQVPPPSLIGAQSPRPGTFNMNMLHPIPGGGGGTMPHHHDEVGSQASFRLAMKNPCQEYFVDNL